MAKAEVGLEMLVAVAVVCRVVWALFSTGSGILWLEGLALLALLGAGIVTELGSGDSNLALVKPRKSVSSGILLGAVTVPAVLAARLVKVQRCCYDLGSSGVVGFAGMKFGFWMSIACSLSMLLFIITSQCKQRPGRWFLSALFEYLSVLLVLVSALKHRSTWSLKDEVCYSIVYIMGGKILFPYAFRAFPFTGTIGEVMLVVQGIVVYGATTFSVPFTPPTDAGNEDKAEGGIICTLLQGLILGTLGVPLLMKFLGVSLSVPVESRKDPKLLQKSVNRVNFISCKAVCFYSLLVGVVFGIVPLWVRYVTHIWINPVIWSLQYVVQGGILRISIFIYWLVNIGVPLPYLYNISAQNKVPTILARKYYHVMIVLMFAPAHFLDPKFLHLAFGIAFVGFLVIEMMRVGNLPPCGHQIASFMTVFTDYRDSGPLIISHFSLLLGCALPVWLNSGAGDRPLASYAGILSLGVLDSVASFVGYNFGSIPVSPRSKKTLEGTLAGIGSLLACLLFLSILLPSSQMPGNVRDYLSLIGAASGAGILEAYLLQLDNAFLPLLFYALLCV